MRRILQLALLLVLVGGASFFLWTKLFPSPERKIRKCMAELQDLASFRESEGNLAVLASLQRLGSLFTEDATVHVDVEGGPKVVLTGRDSIMQAAAAVRRGVGGLNVEFLDVAVTLGGDKRSAVVEATGTARQKDNNELWVEELRFHFIETEEGWRIVSVETVQTLTRAAPGDRPGMRVPPTA